jgi:nitric oxide reductase subunit B
LFLVIRVLLPALRKPGEQKQLVALLAVSTRGDRLFYGAGLTWGQHTHCRSSSTGAGGWSTCGWKGFFEVFATTVIAFFFMRLNLIRPALPASGAAFGHHLPVGRHHRHLPPPLLLRARRPWRWPGARCSAPWRWCRWCWSASMPRKTCAARGQDVWVQRYKWPIYFFISVAFWNMVGAGLFGFMINPPIALYYMQGLNTTPLTRPRRVFGVYGMLGIGLMLVCLRALIAAA